MFATEEASSKIHYRWTAVVQQCKQRVIVQVFDAARQKWQSSLQGTQINAEGWFWLRWGDKNTMLTKSKDTDHSLALSLFRPFRAGMVKTGMNRINHFSQASKGHLWTSIVQYAKSMLSLALSDGQGQDLFWEFLVILHVSSVKFLHNYRPRKKHSLRASKGSNNEASWTLLTSQ